MESINKTPTLFYSPADSAALYNIDEKGERTSEAGWAARIMTNTQLGIDVWGHNMSREETEQVTKVLCASYEMLAALEHLVSANPNDSSWNYQAASEEARKLIFRIKNG